MATMSELAMLAVSERRPLTAADSEVVWKTNSPDLLAAWRSTRLREDLVHPQEDMLSSVKRANMFGFSMLSLTPILRRKWRHGKGRPNPYKLLTALRRQWKVLIKDLEPEARARVQHCMQVQLAPACVKERFLPLGAITFSVSKNHALMPHRPFPLRLLKAQWLTFSRREGYVTAFLREGNIEVNEDQSTYLNPEKEYNFNMSPSRSGSAQVLSTNRRVTLANGLAMSEAVEDAVATGVGAQSRPRLPDLYVPGPTVSSFELDAFKAEMGAEQLPEDIQRSLMQKLRLWWDAGCDASAVRAKYPSQENPHGINQLAWLDTIEDDGMVEALANRVPDFWAVVDILKESVWSLIYAVWMSDLRWTDTKVLFPLSHFLPGSTQKPIGRYGELFCLFPREMLGRTETCTGTIELIPDAAAVQVFEIESKEH